MAKKTKAAVAETDAEEEAEVQALPPGTVYIGKSVKPEFLYLRLANRHGLITGATGTGKTVTMQGMCEDFSRAGVPVFCADIKGDFAGIAMTGEPKGWIEQRAELIGYDVGFQAFPVVFWDLFGKQGHPIRSTITEMGPVLLSRLMGLSDAQEGILNIAFRIADDEGLLLLDLKDLRALLANLAERADQLTTAYGNITKASVGAIQRSLLVLEQQGGDNFFGEPAIEIDDLMRTAPNGEGYVNILVADTLMQNPRLYATFLLFLLSELFEKLPEVGDLEKPKLVFFFDEAHLLFTDAPPALLQKIEQVVRLIRSKGVGVYFVTQNPLDVPDSVSSQLGNRVQHALRAFTPREQRAVKAAAETFRQNPAFNTQDAIMQLGVGEALVSTLDAKGQPTMVERTLVKPPAARVGVITEKEREAVIGKSPVKGRYDKSIDRHSAYEMLAEAAKQAPAENKSPTGRGRTAEPKPTPGIFDRMFGWLFGTGTRRRLSATQRVAREVARRTGDELGATVGRRYGGAAGAQAGRSIARGVLGGILKR
jgi:uncharacterized protein